MEDRIALAAFIVVWFYLYVFKFPFIYPAPKVQKILFDILLLAPNFHLPYEN